MNRLYPVSVNSPPTTTTAPIDEDDTTIPVSELGEFPPGRNLAVLKEGAITETVEYTGKSAPSGSGNLTGVTRGFQGDALAWDTGTEISRMLTAYDYDALRENLNDTSVLEDQVEGETLEAFDLVALGDDGEWYQADATNPLAIGQVGVYLGEGRVQILGKVSNEGWSFPASTVLYAGNTPGTIATSPGTFSRRIGYALSPTTIFLMPFEGGQTMIGIQIFTDNANTPVVGREISFSAVIQTKYGISSYDWDFDDESTHSTAVSPTHTYAEAGSYTVVLTVTDSEGNTFSTRHTLTVIERSPQEHQGGALKEQCLERISHDLILTPVCDNDTTEHGLSRLTHSVQITNS